jgi:electron transfer flavoprotein alpha subunit
MATSLLVVAEVSDGVLTRLSTEVATFARALAGEAGVDVAGLVIAPDPTAPAAELATYLPIVHAVAAPELSAEVPAARLASTILELIGEGTTHLILGASADGRDVAGMVVGLTGWGLLANVSRASWDAQGLETEALVLGGKVTVRSRLTGSSGVLTVPPGAVTAAEAAASGSVVDRPAPSPRLPAVRVLDRVVEAGAEVSLEDAKVIVVGGRGVGGPEGFALVGEIAGLLGGVVAATRASVDSGWIPYARQVGQTGRTVKPRLYLGLGVSGAMQHRVGMQSSETIIVVNRDPDAPIREIADLMVVGDLFQVGPALVDEIRTRTGG